MKLEQTDYKFVIVFDIGEFNIKSVVIKKKWTQSSTLEFDCFYGRIEKSEGIENGNITDLQALSNSIFQSVYKSEIDTGQDLEVAIISFSFGVKRSEDYRFKTIIQNREVTESLYSMKRPEHLDYVDNFFFLDGNLVRNPLSMKATELEQVFSYVPQDRFLLENLVSAVKKTDLIVSDVVFGPTTLSRAISFENRAPNIIVDLGGTSTRVIVRFDRTFYFSLPLGIAHLYEGLDKTEKVSLSFFMTSPNIAEKTRRFFKLLFIEIFNRVEREEFFKKYDVVTYLSGACLFPMLDLFLSQTFDRTFKFIEFNWLQTHLDHTTYANCFAAINHVSRAS